MVQITMINKVLSTQAGQTTQDADKGLWVTSSLVVNQAQEPRHHKSDHVTQQAGAKSTLEVE